MNSKNKTLSFFRRVAFAEGVSFLVLLLIALPLKYLAGLPQLVTVVGWAHGVLFVAFLALAVEVKGMLSKDLSWLFKAFAASVIPAGTFILERNMRRDGDFDRAA